MSARSTNKQRGFSLIEIMIATTLGMFLLAGLMTAYLGQKKIYRFNEGLARIQENGRTAITRLGKDIKMTGYIGCGRLMETSLHNLLSGLDFSLETSVVGFHNSVTTATYHSEFLLPILKAMAPQTDLLIVQQADPNTLSASHDQEIKLIDNEFNYKVGDTLLLSNCYQAHIFHVQEIHNQELVPVPNFAEKYDQADSQISHFLTIVFYIANTGRKNQAGDSIYALYRRNMNDPPSRQSEWIEGVEDMKIDYGLFDSTTKTIRYYTADAVPEWKKIVCVKISLLIDSVEEVCDSPSSYQFQGKTKIAPDRRLRKEWSTVIFLRNRCIHWEHK